MKMGEIRLDNCCRLCLKEGFSLTNIFSQHSAAGDPLYRILNFIYEMKIFENDGLPSQICSPCMWRMIEFDACKRNVRSAEAEIMRLLNETRPCPDEAQSNSFVMKTEDTEMDRASEMGTECDTVQPERPEENYDSLSTKAEVTEIDGANQVGIDCDAVHSEINIKEEIDIEEWQMPKELKREEMDIEGQGNRNTMNIDLGSCSSKVILQGKDLELKESDLFIDKVDAIQEEGRKLRPRKQINYTLDRQSPGLDFNFSDSESSDYTLSDSRSSSDESYGTRRNKVSFTGESHHPERFEKGFGRVQLEANAQFKRRFHNHVERLRKRSRDDSFFDSGVLECARVVDEQDVSGHNRNNVPIEETQDNAPSPVAASSKGPSGTIDAELDIPRNAKPSQGDSGSGNQSDPSKLYEHLSNAINSAIPCETAVILARDGKECVEGSPLDGSAAVSGGNRNDRFPVVDEVPIGLQQDSILNHSNCLKASTGSSNLPSNDHTHTYSDHAKLPGVIGGAEEEAEHVVLAHDAKGLETTEKTCERRINLGMFVRSIVKSSVVKHKEELGKESRHLSPANGVTSKLTSSDDDMAAEAVCDGSDSSKSDGNASEFSEDDLGDERELETRRDYLCHLCGKVYSRCSSLYTHMKIHDRKLPFACDKCPKTFRRKGQLETHMLVHSDERPFKCDKCSKSFKMKIHLQQHGISHTGKRKYPCAHCEESFRTRWQFALHQKSHEGKVQWACDCGEQCESWEELLQHQAEHKRNRSWKCEHCSKLFYKKELLVKHFRIHTKPFLCSICGKGFASAEERHDHISAHTGEKHHRCDLCGMKFQRRTTMVKHRRVIHSDLAPFKCRFCNYRSKYKFEWKKHERRLHDKEMKESGLSH